MAIDSSLTPTVASTNPLANGIVGSGSASSAILDANQALDQHIASLQPTTAPGMTGPTSAPGAPTPKPGTPAQPTEQQQIDTVNASPVNDQYTGMLQSMIGRSNATTASLISSIQANRANVENKANDAFDRYSKGLQVLGLQNGTMQATPELMKAQLMQAENDHLAKIQSLDQEEQKAVATAESARDNNQYKLMVDSMNYAQKVKAEKVKAIQDLYTSQTKQDATYQKQATFAGQSIYNALKNVPASKQADTILAISKSLGIPANYVMEAYQNQTLKQPKAKSSSYAPKNGVYSTAEKNSISGLLQTGKAADGTVIGNGRGADGLVDPATYQKGYAYAQKVGPAAIAKFLKDFPPLKNVDKKDLDQFDDTIKNAYAAEKKASKATSSGRNASPWKQ